MLEKRIKINSSSRIIKDKLTVNGHAWRIWTVSLEAPQQVDLKEHLEHVEYTLHESFGSPPIVCKEPPYQIQREGWGEFDLRISLHLKDPLLSSPQTFLFDLNFKKPKYFKFKRVTLGSDSDYKQEDGVDTEFDEEDTDQEDMKRPHPGRRVRRGPHRMNITCGKKSKRAFKRQRTISSASSSSSSSSSASATRLITADNNNKDLQEKPPQQDILHQHKQYNPAPQCMINQKNETEAIDLSELKVLLEALDEPNLRKVYSLMCQYDTSTMDIKETDDGHYLIDINSACADLINKLWEFVIDVEIDKCKESSILSEISVRIHHTSR